MDDALILFTPVAIATAAFSGVVLGWLFYTTAPLMPPTLLAFRVFMLGVMFYLPQMAVAFVERTDEGVSFGRLGGRLLMYLVAYAIPALATYTFLERRRQP